MLIHDDTQTTDSATSQWFANLEKIKDDALKAVRDVSFFPPLCMPLRYPYFSLCSDEKQPVTGSNLSYKAVRSGASRDNECGAYQSRLFTTGTLIVLY